VVSGCHNAVELIKSGGLRLEHSEACGLVSLIGKANEFPEKVAFFQIVLVSEQFLFESIALPPLCAWTVLVRAIIRNESFSNQNIADNSCFDRIALTFTRI